MLTFGVHTTSAYRCRDVELDGFGHRPNAAHLPGADSAGFGYSVGHRQGAIEDADPLVQRQTQLGYCFRSGKRRNQDAGTSHHCGIA